MSPQVISFVEKGWAGARQFSITLVRQGMTVEHVVKGKAADDVVAMVTPYPGMRISSVSRRWYRFVTWVILLFAVPRRHLEVVIVDNARTAQWVSAWFPALRKKLVLIQEQGDGSPRIIREPLATAPSDASAAPPR